MRKDPERKKNLRGGGAWVTREERLKTNTCESILELNGELWWKRQGGKRSRCHGTISKLSLYLSLLILLLCEGLWLYFGNIQCSWISTSALYESGCLVLELNSHHWLAFSLATVVELPLEDQCSCSQEITFIFLRWLLVHGVNLWWCYATEFFGK